MEGTASGWAGARWAGEHAALRWWSKARGRDQLRAVPCRATSGPLSCALGPREDRPGPPKAPIAVLDGLGKSPRHSTGRR